MKIAELEKKLGITAEEVRKYAKLLDQEIPEHKVVLTKQLAADIEMYHKKQSSKEQKLEVQADEKGFPIPPVISVKHFSEIVNVPVNTVIMQLVKNGFMVSINENIDFEIAQLISEELGIQVYMLDPEKERDALSDETLSKAIEGDKKTGIIRAPVVSVMGHVDHGKTSLLDVIRKTNVVGQESGSITQSIGAYQVHVHGRDITFIDTPGHEAFIAMRRRGVHATDIAVLVVAANEGVKSQTKEAMAHAKEANINIIVAITKIDLKEANVQKVKTELSEIGLVPEEWGGQTMMVEVSPKKNIGIDKLLESILLLADILELKATEARAAVGTIIESNLDSKLGKVATVLIHTGTLYPRDIFVIGSVTGRVRQLIDDTGKSIQKAGPSMPVLITGLDDLPEVGDILQVVDNEKEGNKMADEYKKKYAHRAKQIKDMGGMDLISNKMKEEGVKGIRIILKGDNLGSIEAIENSLKSVRTENARIKVIRARTGNISQSDILLAQAVNAKLIGFNVDYASNDVKRELKERGVEVQMYNVIYKLVEELTQQMISSIEPEYEDRDLGIFKVKKIFLTKKNLMILGGLVKEGYVEPNSKVKVYRDGNEIGIGALSEVKKGVSTVNRVDTKEECGVQFSGKAKIKEGDEFKVYKTELKKIELTPKK